jgi:hypothetical protein
MPNKNKQTIRKKSVAKKKMSPKRKVARKRAASKQSSLGRKKVAREKAVSMQSSLARRKEFSAKRKRVTSTGLVVETVTVPLPSGEPRERRDGQSGDLQGISNRPTASSESVEELLEEGNALEAEAVQGVENALDADREEVETHEVPEDDVPQEYLDKDR